MTVSLISSSKYTQRKKRTNVGRAGTTDAREKRGKRPSPQPRRGEGFSSSADCADDVWKDSTSKGSSKCIAKGTTSSRRVNENEMNRSSREALLLNAMQVLHKGSRR